MSEKVQARSAVNNAIAAGKLVRQPCEVCGDIDSQAHHADYAKPLEVQWLCVTHHRVLHLPTHCKRGHEFTQDNTIIDHRGHRACKECTRAHKRKNYHSDLDKSRRYQREKQRERRAKRKEQTNA